MKSTFGVAIQLLNATQLQILITKRKKKKGKEKNILAEFFRNANQVLKLLDCRAINIPTRDLVSITSSHKTRVPLGSLEAVVNIYYLFRYNNLKQPLRNTL